MRERVTRAARELFLEHGFGATSLDTIARAAGVHRDTLYRQYGNKERLCRLVIAEGMSRMRQGVTSAVGAGGPPEQVLARVARQVHADVAAPEAQVVTRMVVAESRRFSELTAAAYADWVTDLAALITYLEQQCAAGVLTIDDPAEGAHAFVSSASGGVRFLMAPPLTGPKLEAHLRRTVALYLTGWHHRPAPSVAAKKKSTRR
jgi:TetR/AcrR family transcriptional repressor of mexJK operon